jgi:hypothetical protein
MNDDLISIITHHSSLIITQQGATHMSSGMLGSGGFFGSDMGPRGQYGVWPGCGCSSLIIILAGILLVCGGGLKFFNM